MLYTSSFAIYKWYIMCFAICIKRIKEEIIPDLEKLLESRMLSIEEDYGSEEERQRHNPL